MLRPFGRREQAVGIADGREPRVPDDRGAGVPEGPAGAAGIEAGVLGRRLEGGVQLSLLFGLDDRRRQLWVRQHLRTQLRSKTVSSPPSW